MAQTRKATERFKKLYDSYFLRRRRFERAFCISSA